MTKINYFIRDVPYRNLVGKHEGGKQLGRPRSRWEDNIKKDVFIALPLVLLFSSNAKNTLLYC
jgi:hypothetical protein